MVENHIIPKFSTSDKLIWGSASFGTSLIAGVYAAMLVMFFHVYLELDPVLIAIAAILYAIWNAINDPLFGFMSDKTKGKRGRRIPYMQFTAPFLALFFIVIWFVPPKWDDFGIFWWMLITMLLYDTAYTIIGLVYSALLPEITEDDSERGELQKYNSLFYLFGAIFGFLIPDLLRPKAGETNLFPLYIGMIVVGIASAICVVVTTLRFKERPEFTLVDEPLSLVDSVKYTFKSKAFLILTAANFMSILFQQILLSYLFYLADYVMRVSTVILILSIFLGLIIGVFFANVFANKFGFVKANQIFLIIGAIPLIMLPFIPLILIYLCLFLGGFGLSGPLVLTNVLYAQVADEDETKSGVRREASFFGTNAMITKPAQSIAIAIGPLLLALAGFKTGGKIILDQPESALFMIKVLVGLIPGIAMVIGALILLFYPLKGKYLKEIQDRVLKMHVDKKQKLAKKQIG